MCACVHICECMHVYTHVWRPEVGTGHLGCVLTYLKTEELLNLDRLLTNKPQGSSCLQFLSTGIKGVHRHTQFLWGSQEIKLPSL